MKWSNLQSFSLINGRKVFKSLLATKAYLLHFQSDLKMSLLDEVIE